MFNYKTITLMFKPILKYILKNVLELKPTNTQYLSYDFSYPQAFIIGDSISSQLSLL